MKQVLTFIVLILVALGCKTSKKSNPVVVNNPVVIKDSVIQEKQPAIKGPIPEAMVYKTKGNYYNRVPVVLSEDKSHIVSFPDPKNIYIETGLPLPFPMGNGYFLDNYGIGLNTVFLKMTYEEYVKLEKAPSAEELFTLILDKNPLLELCDCGLKSQYSNPPMVMLNRYIDSNTLRVRCKVLK